MPYVVDFTEARDRPTVTESFQGQNTENQRLQTQLLGLKLLKSWLGLQVAEEKEKYKLLDAAEQRLIQRRKDKEKRFMVCVASGIAVTVSIVVVRLLCVYFKR
ncbi:MAG: hypothetical protein WC371_03195 [Parachlamydiales bacterium]|jgi:hypothetical protein